MRGKLKKLGLVKEELAGKANHPLGEKGRMEGEIQSYRMGKKFRKRNRSVEKREEGFGKENHRKR